MVAEKATPRMVPEGRNGHEHQHHAESITPEPTTSCGVCDSVESLYVVGGGFLCLNCVAITVSMAANDIWEGHVIYDKTFEDVLLS